MNGARNKLGGGASLAAAVVTTALAGCTPPAGAAAPAGDDHPLVGAPAPEFSLPRAWGNGDVSLNDAGGKVQVVDFWATWCEPCRKSFPFYEELQQRHAAELRVVGISVDEAPDPIQSFAKETGVSFPLAWDRDQLVASQYRLPTMPTSYVIDEHRIVRFVFAGYDAGDGERIEQSVRSLLQP
ncbi:MAG TPA: TlpA disulfide reductase family protein [Polyangiaceae bacterium]|nr:TlpA disulfide reductase family protein [Polyangiaceae bacterium]